MKNVVVFGYAGGATACCDPASGCCGPSPLEVAKAVDGLAKERFPGAFQVRYVDTFSLEALDYAEVMQAIQDQGLSLPVLAVEGKPRLSGDFSMAAAEQALREVLAE